MSVTWRDQIGLVTSVMSGTNGAESGLDWNKTINKTQITINGTNKSLIK
jgi:hypothetical protein